MWPTWVLSAPDGPHVGPMKLAIRDGRCHTQCDPQWLDPQCEHDIHSLRHRVGLGWHCHSIIEDEYWNNDEEWARKDQLRILTDQMEPQMHETNLSAPLNLILPSSLSVAPSIKSGSVLVDEKLVQRYSWVINALANTLYFINKTK